MMAAMRDEPPRRLEREAGQGRADEPGTSAFLASLGRDPGVRDRDPGGTPNRFAAMRDEPTRRRPPRPVPLAPGAGAHRRPRRRDLARGPRAGRRGDLDGVARLALRPGDGPRDGPADRLRGAAPRLLRGDAASPARRPTSPATLQAVLDEFATRIAPHTLNSFHPRAPQLLHAAAAGRLDRRRGARPVDATRASTSGTRVPSRAFVEEEVVRWLCDLVGYGEGSFGLLTSGGVMANFIAMALVRDVHLRALTGAAAAAARGRARGRPRLRQRPGPLLDRPGARRARLPARDPRPRPGRRRVPAPRGAGRRGHRRGTAPRACGRSPSPPSPGRPTRARSTSSRSWRRSPRREGLWLHVDAAYGGAARLSARDADRVPGLAPRGQRHDRPPQVVLPGLRRRRAARPRRRATCARRSTARPSTTAAARRRSGPADGETGDHADDRRRPRRPAQLLQARLRGDPPVPGAQAVGDLEAPRHERPRPAHRAQRRHRRVPRRRAAPRPTTSRRSPSGPS